MDTQAKKELIRLYELAELSTATTNFYDRVYKYIKFIKTNEFLSVLLEKDNKDWHIYDLERLDTRPKQVEGESWSKHFFKEMRHMSSGDGYFLSHYFLTLTIDIYDFYDFHYKEGREYNELDIMMHGRKVLPLKEKISKFLKPKDILPSNTDDIEKYNLIYIDHFQDWKNFLKTFHSILLKRIQEIEEENKDSEIKNNISINNLSVTFDNSKIVHNNTVTKEDTPIHKILVIVDSKKGIYREDNNLSYDIKNPSKRLDIIYLLCEKETVYIKDIEEKTKQTNTLIMKEISKINSLCREKLKLAYDFIIHNPTGGFSLNRDNFSIKTQ